jgi:hypothetical protein
VESNTQCFKEPSNNLIFNRVAGNPLTNWCAGLLFQVIAQILRATFVLHAHFVATLAAVGDAMQ